MRDAGGRVVGRWLTCTALRHNGRGESSGGIPFTIGSLRHVLGNRVYLGEITHKGKTFAGEHEAIITQECFAAVQASLSRNRRVGGSQQASSQALLQGRIFNGNGDRMTPTHANKKAVRYRYYVSPPTPGTVSRVPAPELEREVISALGASGEGAGASATPITDRLERVTVHADRLEIYLRADESDDAPADPIIVPWRAPVRSRHRDIEAPIEAPAHNRWAERKVIRAEARARLIEGIAKARHHIERIVTSDDGEIARIAAAKGCSERSVRMNLSLAFLSPQMVKAAVEGNLPYRFGVSAAATLSPCWREQAEVSAAPLGT